MKSLHTLWVNQNRITNLSSFIETVAKCFPNLKYFSMMNNEAAPSYFNGGTYQQYKDYRYGACLTDLDELMFRFNNLASLNIT